MQLTEAYRPRTWDEVVGQEKVIGRIQVRQQLSPGWEPPAVSAAATGARSS
jgi:hypothetical protein